jgi:uncharacterized protein YbjT (DUF2867 family)
MTAKPVVFVIGASGKVGAGTVTNLSTKYADQVEIRAGVRNPEKAEKIKSLPGVEVVQASMGDEKLVEILSGVDALFINTPSVEDRVKLTVATAELAKKAGVKHLVVVSVTIAGLNDTIFGRQFGEIEKKVSQLGVPYTSIRLPSFFENFWGFKDTISGEGKIYSPIDPDKPLLEVAAVEDGGSVGATVLVNPSSYTNKIIDVISDIQTYNEVAKDFSSALGKEIKYVRVPYEAVAKSLLEKGVPQWQVDGMFQYYKLIDAANPVPTVGDTESFAAITGEQPTTLKKWLAKHVESFK